MEKLPKQVFASETAYLMFNKSGWMQHTGGFYQEGKGFCTLNGGKIQYNDAGLSDWVVKTQYRKINGVNHNSYAEVWPNGSTQIVTMNRGFNINTYTGGTFFVIFHCKDEASKKTLIEGIKKTDTKGNGVFGYTSSGNSYTVPAKFVWTNGLDVIAARPGDNRFGYILGTNQWDPALVNYISIVTVQKELTSAYLRKSEY